MAVEITEGKKYKEKNPAIKFPKVVKVRKIQNLGKITHVQFMAHNAAAQAAHPNGGFIPIDSFLKVWEPAE